MFQITDAFGKIVFKENFVISTSKNVYAAYREIRDVSNRQ